MVVDASAFIEYLARTRLGRQVETILEDPDSDIHTIASCDIEVVGGLRRGGLPTDIVRERMAAYLDLPVARHGHQLLVGRIIELGDAFGSTDAAYVALCERLGATLVTGDAGLTRAVTRALPLNVIGVI